MSREVAPEARSQNICPLHLIRAPACADGATKLLRKKKNESSGLPPLAKARRPPLDKLEETKMRKCSRWLSHIVAVGLTATPFICLAQDAATSTLRGSNDEAEAETETEEIVVSATRLPIPEDQSPASVTLLDTEEL